MSSRPGHSRINPPHDSNPWMIRLSPVLFVWLWSTGFIGAKYGLPYAEPFTLLLYRMLVTLVVLGMIGWWLKSNWPSPRAAMHTAVTGLLVHGLYLGGVFYAIKQGMPAGVVALIVGLQPLVTAVAAVLVLHEGVRARQWFGLALGFAGVGLVLFEKMGAEQMGSFPAATLIWACIALVGISLGTVYQKRHGQGVELLPATFIQYCAATILFAFGSFLFESAVVSWNIQLVLAIGWLVLGLSVGAILLLMQLIQRGAASQVASLFYLVPPVTALEAFILFDERLGVVAVCGGALTVAAVALVVVKKSRQVN